MTSNWPSFSPLTRKVLTSLKSLLKASRYSHWAVGISIKKHKRKRRLEAGRDFPETREVSRLLAAAEGIQNGVRFY